MQVAQAVPLPLIGAAAAAAAAVGNAVRGTVEEWRNSHSAPPVVQASPSTTNEPTPNDAEDNKLADTTPQASVAAAPPMPPEDNRDQEEQKKDSSEKPAPSEQSQQLIPGYTQTESNIVNEAKGILDLPEFSKIRDAYANNTDGVVVNIEGRSIQYEPTMPSAGMTDFNNNGFFVGPEAFKSEEEVGKTVLHELHRLYTSGYANGVSGELVAKETSEASDFADRAITFFGAKQ